MHHIDAKYPLVHKLLASAACHCTANHHRWFSGCRRLKYQQEGYLSSSVFSEQMIKGVEIKRQEEEEEEAAENLQTGFISLTDKLITELNLVQPG